MDMRAPVRMMVSILNRVRSLLGKTCIAMALIMLIYLATRVIRHHWGGYGSFKMNQLSWSAFWSSVMPSYTFLVTVVTVLALIALAKLILWKRNLEIDTMLFAMILFFAIQDVSSSVQTFDKRHRFETERILLKQAVQQCCNIEATGESVCEEEPLVTKDETLIDVRKYYKMYDNRLERYVSKCCMIQAPAQTACLERLVARYETPPSLRRGLATQKPSP